MALISMSGKGEFRTREYTTLSKCRFNENIINF
jgi:hypothetical protein